jgi:26S proteasome regulatory subunit N8
MTKIEESAGTKDSPETQNTAKEDVLTSLNLPSTPERVVVHPLVLLSVVDHYNRVAKNTKKRVVGVLLGQHTGKHYNVANSFAGKVQYLYGRVHSLWHL